MKKLTILVDMDDTIESLGEAWIGYLNNKYHTNVCKEDVTDWDISKAFPGIDKPLVYQPLRDKALWKSVKPLPGAAEYLKKLIDDGHKVLIVTTSNPDSVPMKLRYTLFPNFPFFTYHDVIITSQKQLVRGDILIDDGIHNLIGGEYYKILMSAHHNRSFDAEANDMIRAESWEEVYSIIQKFASEN